MYKAVTALKDTEKAVKKLHEKVGTDVQVTALGPVKKAAGTKGSSGNGTGLVKAANALATALSSAPEETKGTYRKQVPEAQDDTSAQKKLELLAEKANAVGGIDTTDGQGDTPENVQTVKPKLNNLKSELGNAATAMGNCTDLASGSYNTHLVALIKKAYNLTTEANKLVGSSSELVIVLSPML